jgi:hypothetical protein
LLDERLFCPPLRPNLLKLRLSLLEQDQDCCTRCLALPSQSDLKSTPPKRRYMKINHLIAIAAMGAAISLVAVAQNEPRQGRGGGSPWGHPVSGQITEIAADHITIKSESGESIKVLYTADTRVMQPPTAGEAGGQGHQHGGGEPIKITDLKVGDAVGALGQSDPTTKAISAFVILRMDAETLKHAKEMEASFGKTWLAGKVTAINETTITLTGQLDGKPHSFVVDENTSFSQRREAITLADIKVGDNLRVQGALKGELFTATKVNDMGEFAPGNHPGGGQGTPPAGAPKQ